MESLGMMRTIMGMVQDILSAAETASRNKSRCDKVAERVRCIEDILEAAGHDQDGTPAAADDATTRRLLERLEEALGRALQVVRRCQRNSVLRSVIVAGGRMADPLDGVEADIDRCILDLTLANSLRTARRLETTLVQHTTVAAPAAASSTEDNSEKDEKKKKKKQRKCCAELEGVVADKKKKANDLQVPSGAEMEHDNTTAIGVPACTAATEAMHEHELMVPPPFDGYAAAYGYYRSYHGYGRNHGCGCGCGCCCCCWEDDDAGGPSSDAAAYCCHTQTQYSPYPPPSMFSDDDPNSCSIM